MESHWLRRDGGSKSVIIFVLGWGCDHRVVEHITPDGFDILTLYDYRSLPSAPLELGCYHHIYLFAWSFGVWVAEQLFSEIELTLATALNGTPLPVDREFGIDPRALGVTLNGIRLRGMDPFNRRAYAEYYPQMKPLLHPRNLEQNIEELERLIELGSNIYDPTIRWDEGIIGSEDGIFSPENMARYWGERAKILPLPHYPFGSANIILDRIEDR